MNLARICLLVALFVGMQQSVMAVDDAFAVFHKQASFADVKESIEMAIKGRGFVINNVSHIGNMLERTAKDLGSGKKVILEAEALEFCSATVSRQMMEADPNNIVFSPYIIALFVLPEKPKEVRIVFRKTQLVGSAASKKSLQDVKTIVIEIIKKAIQ